MLTVIIPAWNRAHCLRRSVGSVLSQLESDDELIIVDDSSTDETAQTAKDIASEDARVRFLTNTRKKGAPGARNTGIYAANPNNDWIAFLDSDDIWRPGFYNQMLGAARTTHCIDVVTCHTELIDESHQPPKVVGKFTWVAEGNIIRKLLDGTCYVDMNGAIIRRTKILEIGGFDESCPSFQEWDLHLRLAKTCAYSCVQEPLVTYFQHSGQMSKSGIKTIRGLLFVMKKFRGEWYRHSGHDGWISRCKLTAEEFERLKVRNVSVWLDAFRTDWYFFHRFLDLKISECRHSLKQFKNYLNHKEIGLLNLLQKLKNLLPK